MVSSGRVRETSATTTSNTDCTNYTLTEEELSLLDAVYIMIVPRYSTIRKQYCDALHKATNARTKSTFPTRDKWIPPGGYQDGDRELLLGPQLHRVVEIHKHLRNVLLPDERLCTLQPNLNLYRVGTSARMSELWMEVPVMCLAEFRSSLLTFLAKTVIIWL